MIIPIILLIATYLLNLIDYQQTIYAVNLFGLGVELNPIGCFMLANNWAGLFKIVIMPIMLAIVGFIVKLDRKQVWAVCFLFIWFLCVVIHNFCMLTNIHIF
jgi:hypothetical protein